MQKICSLMGYLILAGIVVMNLTGHSIADRTAIILSALSALLMTASILIKDKKKQHLTRR